MIRTATPADSAERQGSSNGVGDETRRPFVKEAAAAEVQNTPKVACRHVTASSGDDSAHFGEGGGAQGRPSLQVAALADEDHV